MIYIFFLIKPRASLMVQWVKKLTAIQETQVMLVQSMGWEDPLEEHVATHSSIFAWKIPWIEEPGRLLYKGSRRVSHHWALMHASLNPSKPVIQRILFVLYRCEHESSKSLCGKVMFNGPMTWVQICCWYPLWDRDASAACQGEEVSPWLRNKAEALIRLGRSRATNRSPL